VRDVDAEAVDAPVEPEPHDVLELRVDLGVPPVQVGLLGSEQVEAPLPVRDRRLRRIKEIAEAIEEKASNPGQEQADKKDKG
jgi:hypothetical protein